MSSPRIDWLAWLQLLRVANVFTAASNVIAGYLLVQRGWEPLLPLLLLILTSVLLYEAGMVLNDVCDVELDAIERPERPIPSGRVTKRAARVVGIALLGGGVFMALTVSWLTLQWRTAQISLALAATIVGYNLGIKSIHWGPLAMGGCRMMSVLLGASVAETLSLAAWVLAGGIGIYTVGLSWLARKEISGINQKELKVGSLLVVFGLSTCCALPAALQGDSLPIAGWIAIWIMLVGLLGFLLGKLLSQPSPQRLRLTVGTLISLFIPIDAAACALAVGWPSGLAVLCLLIPTRILARWTPQT